MMISIVLVDAACITNF